MRASALRHATCVTRFDWRRDTSAASRAGRSRAAGRSAPPPACESSSASCRSIASGATSPAGAIRSRRRSDDGDSRARGRRARGRGRVPAGRTRPSCALRGKQASIALFRIGGAHAIARTRLRHSDGAEGGQDRRARQRVCGRRKGARRQRLRDRFLRRPERDRRRLGQPAVRMDRRRPDRPGRARSGRARDPDHAVEAARQRLSRAPSRGRCRQIGPAPRLARSQRRHRGDADAGRGDRAHASAWRRNISCATPTPIAATD